MQSRFGQVLEGWQITGFHETTRPAGVRVARMGVVRSCTAARLRSGVQQHRQVGLGSRSDVRIVPRRSFADDDDVDGDGRVQASSSPASSAEISFCDSVTVAASCPGTAEAKR